MRILQVGKFYHPHHGGMETVVKSLAQGLVRAGDEVTVLCSSDRRESSEEWIEGVRVLRSATWTTQLSQPISPGLLRNLARQTRARGKPSAPFDLVHFHCPNPIPEIAWLGMDREIPFVVTYHADVVRQRFTRRFYWQALRKFLGRADRILAATQFHIDHSPVLHAFQAKCTLIPFGLDPESSQLALDPDPELQARARELRAKYGRFVLFVGRLVPYKGASYLLQAVKGIEAPVVLIGDGPLRPLLETEASDLGIAPRTHFVGSVASRRELMAHFLACDLFVLPSIDQSEAFGMVLLEALACGKPVITTRIPSGVNFVNQEGVTGLVAKPRDPESLALAIRAIHSDTTLRTRMGQAARARVESFFTQTQMIAAHREAYRSVISGDRARTP